MSVKKQLLSFLLFLGFVFSGLHSYASHVFGGELLYHNISGNTYKITLTLYGDCRAAIFGTLDTSKAIILAYNNNAFFDSLELRPDTIEIDVSPVCPAQINNTTCYNLTSTLPGIKKFVYSNTITLSMASANWRFVFGGSLTVSSAGRSDQITNIASAGSSSMQIEAMLNNLAGPNNSPKYSTIPTPFYCMGVDQQYNQGAIDEDGDSLSFSLVPGVNANGANPLVSVPVTYLAPFTATEPMTTVPGSFIFNNLNGQMSFTPSQIQDALIVNQVSEYRNGVLVGTSKREMTFIVADNCEGTPPSLHIANVTGGAVAPNNIIKMCSGTPVLSFNIALTNPDADSTTITTGDAPPGAVLNVNNNNTLSPSLSFSWNTDTLTTGIYTFYVYLKNNHCPIANRQTIAYTINVVPLPTLTQALTAPTGCVHQALMQYNMDYGYLPRTLTITEGGNVVKTYLDSTGIVIDSLPVGNYVAYASSNPACIVSASFEISDSGKLPLDPYTQLLCKGDTLAALMMPTPGPGTTTTWYDSDFNLLADAPIPNTAVPGTYTWYVTEHYKICTSDKTLATAIVHPLPDIQIKSRQNDICYGDTIYLEATGGVEYSWSPVDRIESSLDGRLFTRLVSGGTFSVRVLNEFGCVDSSSITYSKIEPCCTFYYPNAFTPNGDGHNDGFRVLTHGNMFDYKLAIFNRWGQLVYLSYDPMAYWDGKLYGTPCEVGTYYYTFKARCLTGMTEEKKGDVILIR